MSIVALSAAAKVKTALTYCCVGALSFGASQVYERHAPKHKVRSHHAVNTHTGSTAACLPPSVAPLLAPGERIDIAASIPAQASAAFTSFAVAPVQIRPAIKEPTPVHIPEPAAFALFGLGALAVFRRR